MARIIAELYEKRSIDPSYAGAAVVHDDQSEQSSVASNVDASDSFTGKQPIVLLA